MWEVMTYGERPYWEMSNHEVLIHCQDFPHSQTLSPAPRQTRSGIDVHRVETSQILIMGEDPASVVSSKAARREGFVCNL